MIKLSLGLDDQLFLQERDLVSNIDEILELKKDQILCREGDQNTDLYKIIKGKLLIFTMQGSRVTPLAYLEAGEFVGELSFFDGLPRSASIMAVEPSQLLHVQNLKIKQYFPSWLLLVSQFLTNEIRQADTNIKQKGFKKSSKDGIKPLTIREQSHIFQLMKPR
jgi:CRP/FNR family cyclic AMP-dependent transcriptional regulator